MFTREIRVRYSECDAQGVLFNSHYLAFCDHVMDDFLLEALGAESDFQVMLKSATLNWSGPVRYRDSVTVEAEVSRWGRTSFDVSFRMSVDEKMRCEVTITYVCVALDADVPRPIPMPEHVREAFQSV